MQVEIVGDDQETIRAAHADPRVQALVAKLTLIDPFKIKVNAVWQDENNISIQVELKAKDERVGPDNFAEFTQHLDIPGDCDWERGNWPMWYDVGIDDVTPIGPWGKNELQILPIASQFETLGDEGSLTVAFRAATGDEKVSGFIYLYQRWDKRDPQEEEFRCEPQLADLLRKQFPNIETDGPGEYTCFCLQSSFGDDSVFGVASEKATETLYEYK